MVQIITLANVFYVFGAMLMYVTIKYDEKTSAVKRSSGLILFLCLTWVCYVPQAFFNYMGWRP